MEGNTYKTILFERFNDDVRDLSYLLEHNDRTDVLNGKIEEDLTVHTFQEFLEKFSPDIYEYFKPDGSAVYTVKKPEGSNLRPMKITDHAYYKMLEQCYEQKGASGKSNLEFDDQSILEMLTPAAEIKEAYRLRKSLSEGYKDYERAKRDGEATRPYVEQLKSDMKKVNRTIKNSVVGMLPLLIDDAERKLKNIDSQLKAIESSADGSVQALPPARTASLDKDGRVVYLELPAASKSQDEEGAAGRPVAALIESNYDRHAGDQANPFVRNMLVSVYAPNEGDGSTLPMNLEELQEEKDTVEKNLQSYQALYKNAKASFVEELSSVIEKLLGVKVLFDHATVKGGLSGRLADGLIVANCKIGDLLLNAEEPFREYANWMGKQQREDKKIWFAIIPAVEDAESFDDEDEDDDDDIFGLPEAESGKKKEETLTTVGELKKAISILGDAKIMTFFNLKGNDKNGFNTITADYIDERKRWFLNEPAYDHACYAYPNFTIVRERKIHLATKEQREKLSSLGYPEDVMDIMIPAIYIDAAYPAAGLMIASQQPAFLESKGLPVETGLPCVRVTPADPRLTIALATKFNRENLYQWGDDIRKAITKEGFGFVFSSDALEVDGRELIHTYVLCANTLKKEKGKYVPIEHKMVEDYMRCIYNGTRKTESELQKKIDELKTKWKDANRHKEMVNLMLPGKDEDIVLKPIGETSNKGISITLDDTEAVIEDLVVTTNTKE